ncbi:ribulose-phosphate 3-epimerase [Candidatus Blochmannia ocreatus (nom. nud.)]|uniref:Ribulose-phosphate 3-epimerase n=1 Tax=Candidatus Blochmannia ocreatus (nom. nud.) TaxID=251538 RepID=A0ABY4SVT1_9ENTR|nr:ribulose-phosphate 3-epimerase [Candidatus Blochmannia ocreatus]URJ25045.1 ribulose-phosphate 3-epimerase [Candidatus Blochmannia ocreatus]
MKHFLIAPSILSANFSKLGEDVTNVISAGADILHFDVMDNHYVPNLSMGSMVLKSLREYGINIPIDVHLMTKPIDQLILDFASVGADYISFHPETTEHIDRSVELIKEHGCKAGLVFNPSTTLNYLEYLMDKIDLIVLMAVNPGFSGQVFIPTILKKICKTRKLIDNVNRNIDLSVDGGINTSNIYEISKAGANLFVIGSAIFKAPNYHKIINTLRCILSKT